MLNWCGTGGLPGAPTSTPQHVLGCHSSGTELCAGGAVDGHCCEGQANASLPSDPGLCCPSDIARVLVRPQVHPKAEAGGTSQGWWKASNPGANTRRRQ